MPPRGTRRASRAQGLIDSALPFEGGRIDARAGVGPLTDRFAESRRQYVFGRSPAEFFVERALSLPRAARHVAQTRRIERLARHRRPEGRTLAPKINRTMPRELAGHERVPGDRRVFGVDDRRCASFVGQELARVAKVDVVGSRTLVARSAG